MDATRLVLHTSIHFVYNKLMIYINYQFLHFWNYVEFLVPMDVIPLGMSCTYQYRTRRLLLQTCIPRGCHYEHVPSGIHPFWGLRLARDRVLTEMFVWIFDDHNEHFCSSRSEYPKTHHFRSRICIGTKGSQIGSTLLGRTHP